MRPSIKVALIFVGIWFSTRLLFFWLQLFQDAGGVKILVMWNILCLLLAISIGSLIEKRKENATDSTALGDIKRAMAGGMVYSVLVSGLIYILYSQIDPGYNKNQIARIEEVYKRDINNPKKLAEFRSVPENASLTKEEILKQAMQGPKSFYNPKSTMLLSLLGMMLLTTVNAIVVTIVFRRVLFKQRTL